MVGGWVCESVKVGWREGGTLTPSSYTNPAGKRVGMLWLGRRGEEVVDRLCHRQLEPRHDQRTMGQARRYAVHVILHVRICCSAYTLEPSMLSITIAFHAPRTTDSCCILY